jgi:hypothetical protein
MVRLRYGTTFAVILVAGILIGGCRNKYLNEQRQLENRITRLEKIKKELNDSSIANFMLVLKEMVENIDSIEKSGLATDTLFTENPLLIKDYYELNKLTAMILEKRAVLFEETSHSLKQLKNLKKDMRANASSKSSLIKYYYMELRAADKVERSGKNLISALKINGIKIKVRNKTINDLLKNYNQTASNLNQ